MVPFIQVYQYIDNFVTMSLFQKNENAILGILKERLFQGHFKFRIANIMPSFRFSLVTVLD